MDKERKRRKTVSHFTDLEVRQLARQRAREVYSITRRDPMARDFAMARQVRESVVSVSSNIAEGFERGGNRESVQFLWIASCGELESQLIRSADQDYLDRSELERLCNLTRRVSAMIYRLTSRLEHSPDRGRKYR